LRKSKKIGNKSFVIYILHIHTRYKQILSGEEKTVYYSSSSHFHAPWYEPLIFLFLFLSPSLSLYISRWLIWFKLRGGEWLQPYNCSLFFFIYIYTYICLRTLPLVSITNDYVNRQSWVVIEKNTSMKDSFVFNKVYCILLMSKRLKTKKKPRWVEKGKKNAVFKKITIT
jgi:hypothetical protein